MVAVVNHLVSHSAVDANVLAGDESSLVGAKKQHHVGYVHGIAHAPGGMLRGVGARVLGKVGV